MIHNTKACPRYGQTILRVLKKVNRHAVISDTISPQMLTRELLANCPLISQTNLTIIYQERGGALTPSK